MSSILKRVVIIIAIVTVLLFISLLVAAWYLGAFAEVTLSQSEKPVQFFITATDSGTYRNALNDLDALRRKIDPVAGEWTGVNEAYLVTVWDTCRDLQFTQQIRVVSGIDNQISRFDKVMVGRDTCPIKEIRPIDVRQMKADMSAARAEQKAGKKEQ